ncbi:hypothetical protein [Microvirga splendida]|uniref:AAA+ ATPase domain-containing protein n=1 Tax=Microvirga splendida TaxID=2795727 RepID=A0ABS0XZC2_9HYPH|nr:hypothetical protein [Microvirga splendida]MBJ6125402.1 hypothetical protein [Microvirga splendida]
MREKPAEYRKAVAVQWLCAAADRLLGATSLADMPALMTGYGSILDHPNASAFARAAFSLRQMGMVVSSDASLRQAVYDMQQWEAESAEDDGFIEPPYEVDPESPGIPFHRRVPDNDPSIDAMVAALVGGLPLAEHGRAIADPSRAMLILSERGSHARAVKVDLEDVADLLPEPPQHDVNRRPRGPIDIPLSELRAIAVEFDRIDSANPGMPGGEWLKRLEDDLGNQKVHLLAPKSDGSGLEPLQTLRLDGLKHMIGLPGTGKTTLIKLVLAWLDSREYKVVVLVPSIENAFNTLADLDRYGIKAGLLMGQSPDTRLRHAAKLSERIASIDEARGFGRSVFGADLMGLNCALGGFEEESDEDVFPHLEPPCNAVWQKRELKKGGESEKATQHLCPVGGWCGRLKATRELTRRRIWLGHVLSLDTRLPLHFVEDHIRYIESVAMTSDVVIVDEVDGVQAVLDRKAVSVVDITGSGSSYELKLIEDLMMPAAQGRNDAVAASITDYSNRANNFVALNRALVVQLQADRRRGKGNTHLDAYDDAFITGNRVVGDLFGKPDLSKMNPQERAEEEQRFHAVSTFWDACVREALFRRTVIDDDTVREYDPVKTAEAIGRYPAQVDDAFRVIVERLRDWLAEPSPTIKETHLSATREAIFALIEPRDLGPEKTTELFRFLVHVTTVVMQFLAIVPAQHAMVAEGIHTSPLFQQGISEDFARLVPEALIGRLSGIRFRFQTDAGRTSLAVSYLTFRGTPRMLLYHLHELLRHDGVERGPNVLLTSATSFLAESPSFHIPVGPHYVLRRAGAEAAWRDSVFLFQPIPDPEDPRRKLRFSGAPLSQRSRILEKMVEHFFMGDDPRVLALTRDFEPGRKVAFVVNGYEQVKLVKRHVARIREGLARRVIGVVDEIPADHEGDYVTTAQVESIGARDDWDVIVFPMKALARGVNIVFGGEAHVGTPLFNKAAISTVVFLTRPHPAAESYDFVAGLAGRDSMAFDLREFPADMGVRDIAQAWRRERQSSLERVRRLMRHSVQASLLGDLLEPFVADIMIDILQTIGRAMRNGCKARAIFVDGAWANIAAATGGAEADKPQTSFIVMMRDILRKRVSDPDPVIREVYDALYSPFYGPLSRVEGIRFYDARQDD